MKQGNELPPRNVKKTTILSCAKLDMEHHFAAKAHNIHGTGNSVQIKNQAKAEVLSD